jgi:hypothetical protein
VVTIRQREWACERGAARPRTQAVIDEVLGRKGSQRRTQHRATRLRQEAQRDPGLALLDVRGAQRSNPSQPTRTPAAFAGPLALPLCSSSVFNLTTSGSRRWQSWLRGRMPKAMPVNE